MKTPARKASAPAVETRRYRLREGFVLHQGRFVRKGGDAVEVTRAEYIAHAHKFEADPVDDEDDD
jgi:hypothetical protein